MTRSDEILAELRQELRGGFAAVLMMLMALSIAPFGLALKMRKGTRYARAADRWFYTVWKQWIPSWRVKVRYRITADTRSFEQRLDEVMRKISAVSVVEARP